MLVTIALHFCQLRMCVLEFPAFKGSFPTFIAKIEVPSFNIPILEKLILKVKRKRTFIKPVKGKQSRTSLHFPYILCTLRFHCIKYHNFM